MEPLWETLTNKAEFFYSLDRNVEEVDGFYNGRNADVSRRLRLLQARYQSPEDGKLAMVKDEAEDLLNALLELRGQLRKLQWFAETNRRGFVKITKKLDKKVPSQSSQRLYLQAKIDPLPFASNLQLQDMMKTVNEWLIHVGDVRAFDDNSSSVSSDSFNRISKVNGNIPTGLLENACVSISHQDSAKFGEILARIKELEESEDIRQEILLILLQKSLTLKSWNSVDLLLDTLETVDSADEVNGRNCLHRLIIVSGRARPQDLRRNANDSANQADGYITPATAPTLSPLSSSLKESQSDDSASTDEEPLLSLKHLLSRFSSSQRTALEAKDSYGRIPLHYASQYGFVSSCSLLLEKMQEWGQLMLHRSLADPHWQDSEGSTPLHLSVIGGHLHTTKILLQSNAENNSCDGSAQNLVYHSELDGLVMLATKKGFVQLVTLLLKAGTDVNYQDSQGETALHAAVRNGHVGCIRALLGSLTDRDIDLEVVESSYGWTPLLCAAVEGHLDAVELLVHAGANTTQLDNSGWTAQEHAAFRGYMTIAGFLAKLEAKSDPTDDVDGVSESTQPKDADDTRGLKTTEPVKTFGHRYLTDDTMILVSLGSMDMRKDVQAVDLDRIPLADAHCTQLDTALSIIVSAVGAEGEPSITDLPVQENISTEPIVFTTKDAAKVKLLFDIVPTYAGGNEERVGRGVALLSSIKPSIGSKRITLQGDVSVPIVASATLDVIGTVNFNFLIITPFKHPNLVINENQTYWKSLTSTMVIGHRGLGKNMAAQRSLQLGENTIQSFIAAANLGASYVEFDVQLTKDHIPVIYHDFLVSETGIDAPVHTLTLEQFLHVNQSQSARASRPSSPPHNSTIEGLKRRNSFRQRSMSVGGAAEKDSQDMAERMKHTRDFKKKGFKANSSGNFIQAPFATLEEMFEKLSPNLGFNIEMKYPMLHETEEQEMDTYAVELNSFVDTVLTTVFNHFPSPSATTSTTSINGSSTSSHRPIIFSSFNPDICLLLSFKQPSIPILFLTDAGTTPVGDIRASSLQEAIRFASHWNLLGVVTAAEPLVLCPKLVKVVKGSGLVCVSYGTLNNDEKNVNLQVKEGIDAVIVDSVLAIRKGLRAAEQGDIVQVNGKAEGGVINGVKG